MKLAIYVRCSTKHQSLDTQLSELEAYAIRQGHEITHRFPEFGVSGAKKNRPQLDLLMAAAERQEFEGVLVWKLDRFGRSLSHLIHSIKQLDDWKIAFISFRDQIDLSTPVGRLMFHLICVFAEFERDTIRERVQSGVKHCQETKRTKTGVWFGQGKKKTRNGLQAPLNRDLIYNLWGTGMKIAHIAIRMGVSRQAIHQALKVKGSAV